MLSNCEGISHHPQLNKALKAKAARKRGKKPQRIALKWSKEDIEVVQLWKMGELHEMDRLKIIGKWGRPLVLYRSFKNRLCIIQRNEYQQYQWWSNHN